MGIREKAASWILSCISGGLGANETLNLLKEFDLGYRRTDFLKDYDNLAGIAGKANILKYIPSFKSISEDNITKIAWNLSDKYRVHYTAVVYDKETGEAYGRDISLSSDQKKTLGEWEADIRSDYIVNPSDPDVELGEMQLMDVMETSQ